MRKRDFFLAYVLLVVLQMLIYNYFHISHYLLLTILPVMVLLIPIRFSTLSSLFIAFVTGLVADVFSDGVIGLNAAALVPVALIREWVIGLVFGQELFARDEDASILRQGVMKMTTAIVIVQAPFLFIYIWADSAGTRPFWFNATRFGLSLVISTAVSLLVAVIMAPKRDSRWH